MDLTRAVTHACENMGVPFVTHERTWFGHGIQLIPNGDCLSLTPIKALSKEFMDSPLTEGQARHAARLVADRFLRKNYLEWRVYNENPAVSEWPLSSSGARVLILPSSKNEFAGHPDWQTGWTDNTHALDDFLQAFSVNADQVVLRCHPNWAEKIGNISGHRSLEVYRSWANDRGIYLIASEDKESTYDLIQQADIVVLNGGSSAVEAGVCGKQVICLGPATYAEGGFARMFYDRDSLYRRAANEPLAPRDVVRKTLRFLYSSDRRYPQYVDFVRALQTVKYQYYEGADPERLVQIINSGRLEADDSTVAQSSEAEDDVVAQLESRDWRALSEYASPVHNRKKLEIARRPALKWVDTARARFALGDR
jgi:hypothetical protein